MVKKSYQIELWTFDDFSVNVNLKAKLILPRIEKSSQLNKIKLLFIEKNDIRRFEN